MRRILIANRGLCALKFVMSIRDKYLTDEVCIVGLCAPDDIISDYKYLTQVDEVVQTSNDIYMDIEGLVDICKRHSIDALFPGWGYLSERSDFVSALEDNGIIFMGPTAKTIDMVGNKINSMDMAIEAEVPLCRWSGTIPLKNRDMVVEAVAKVGMPCVLKDADGGGGKGIRILRDDSRETIVTAYNQIIDEMKRVDGEASIFVMELMENCRHIEIQILGDGTSAMHLFGRDCTVQRRNQKLIEEGPIIVAPNHIINKCQESSVRIARMVNYRGLGTVEFLYSPHNDSVTFLEINPRLQVEHIVTELLTDTNLPGLLYEVSCNGKSIQDLFSRHPNAKIKYIHAEECYDVTLPYPKKFVVAARLNAEQPEAEFKPSSGKIDTIEIPNIPNSWSYVSMMNGGEVAGSVDSQFGHLFTIGDTREDACKKMIHLITHTCVSGQVYTTLSFIKNVICHEDFVNNVHTTLWVAHDMFDTKFKSRVRLSKSNPSLSACAEMVDSRSVTVETVGWLAGFSTQGWFRLIEARRVAADLVASGHLRTIPTETEIMLEHNGVALSGTFSLRNFTNTRITYGEWTDAEIRIKSNVTPDMWNIGISVIMCDASRILVRFAGSSTQFRVAVHSHDEKYDRIKMQIGNKTVAFQKPVVRGVIASPISGKVTSVFDRKLFSVGDSFVELEAMKMIFPVACTIAGEYELRVSVGDTIREDDVIAVMKTDETVAEPTDDGATVEVVSDTTSVETIIGTLPRWLYSAERAGLHPTPSPPLPPNPRLDTRTITKLLMEFQPTHVHRIATISCKETVDWFDVSMSAEELAAGDDNSLFGLAEPRTLSSGVAGFFLDGEIPCMVIVHHPTFNHSSMGVQEAEAFLSASKFSRVNKIPRIYICRTSGAYLNYNVDIVKDLVSVRTDSGDWIHRMSRENVDKWNDSVVAEVPNASGMCRIVRIVSTSVDTLNACALIASETSLAYDETMTITYVKDYAVGIGAYLARLGHRVIQKQDNSPLLLTGYKALNQLLGQDLYVSNDQLGGTDVMAANGVTHHTVDCDSSAIALIRLLAGNYHAIPFTRSLELFGTHWKPSLDRIKCPNLSHVFDGGVWCETMSRYAQSTLTGRAYIGGIPFAVIVGNTEPTKKTIPVDPGNVCTFTQELTNSGRVWYPDSAYKTAQTINDANREGVPLLFWVNWRGFSGGTRDMFDEILKYGSMIVDALRRYKQPVYVYLPPHAELRGGAMVVISSGINPNIRMWADPSARVGIIEPAGAYEVKFKKKFAGSSISKTAVISAIDLYDVPGDNSVMTTVPIDEFRDRMIADCQRSSY